MNPLITRVQLISDMQRALMGGHVVIEAPAGFGKSVLLQQLARQQINSHYLALTITDSDVAVLRTRLEPHIQTGATLLLDDVHRLGLHNQATVWLQNQLDARGPGGARFVLAGRTLPLDPGWMAGHLTLTRYRQDQLAFAPTESAVLLADRSPQLSERWHREVAGWPLGVELLARLPENEASLPAVRDRLFAYLARQVFAQLPPDLHTFLHASAVPLAFNDALAAHLLDLPQKEAGNLRKEAQRRNLFLYPGEPSGWLRYHDLIRDYLLEEASSQVDLYRRRTIAWFEAAGDLPQAIEHALDAGFQAEAARLINQLPSAYIYSNDRYLTYQRWGQSLDESLRRQYPGILYCLGDFLYQAEGSGEIPQQYMEQARDAALAQADYHTERMARWRLVCLALDVNEATGAELAELAELSTQPGVDLYASHTYALALADTGRFAQAVHAWQRAIDLARQEKQPERFWRAQSSLALSALLPLGRFAQAQENFTGAFDFFAEQPGPRYSLHQNINECYFASGDWPALTANLAEIERLEVELEIPALHNQTWINYYRGLRAIGVGAFAEADHHLAAMASQFEAGDRRCEIPLARARCWLLRRQGRLTEAEAHAEAELAKPPVFPHYRGLLSLERDIAAGLRFLCGEEGDFCLRAETVALISMRAMPDLVRLRALLALVCHNQGDPRWRHHARAALRGIARPGYARLLIERDPELGHPFWLLLLTEGLAVEQAHKALLPIVQVAQIAPLLGHAQPEVRQRAAELLAHMGKEEALPLLAEAIKEERERATCAVLKSALAHLESLPPPPMQITLLGNFQVVRGGRLLGDEVWTRPVTRRLAQYFALHRNRPLARDQILDDLWPDLSPDKAWANFRTVYSYLRRAYEPYMQSKAASRYFSLEGERYLFDPSGAVTVDIEGFEALVRQTIATAGDHPLPPLPAALLAQLERWQPLLPESPYEEWLIAPRERLLTLYIEGCLYAAQAHLSYGRPAEAVIWAQRAVTIAPWLEEGYHSLMRAYARQGQRSLALKSYEEAVRALQHELAADPSPLTQWLLTRLQQGEEI